LEEFIPRAYKFPPNKLLFIIIIEISYFRENGIKKIRPHLSQNVLRRPKAYFLGESPSIAGGILADLPISLFKSGSMLFS
jgi:hypothetical protein